MTKRIIGIDPGSYSTGYGIIEVFKNKNIKYLTSGCITSKSNYYNRLKKIYLKIKNIFKKFKPLEMAIEKTFIYKNPYSILKLCQINGVIILAALKNLIPIFEYNISKIRKSVVFKGNVNKKYINIKVKKILNINFKLKLDITDALAVAIAHFNLKNK